MATKDLLGKDAPMAQRLRRLRAAMGYTTSAGFAEFIGVSAQRWHNVEAGLPLGNDLAMMLVKKTGISLDWLYFENAAGLSTSLAKRLGAAPLTDKTTKRGSGRGG